MGQTLGVMLTMTTYGTWLRGDRRGWVDNGKILPPNPQIEDYDREHLKHKPFFFDESQQQEAGGLVIRSAKEKLHTPIWALSIEAWHMHIVIGPIVQSIGEASKEFKLSILHGLQLDRPIWSKGYDKRWCFNAASVAARVRYVQRWSGLDVCPYV